MQPIRRLLLATVAAAAVAPLCATAQTFPDKPVRVILPYPASTGPDSVMRIVSEKLSRYWGQQVIVDNRPGGNGWIAIDAFKKAPADGYTLMQADAALMTLLPHLYKKLPYDPEKDFEAVAPMYWTHFFITVAADSKIKTVSELLAEAKSRHGEYNYGSSGVGSHMHLGGAMLESATGVKMTHVPYKETAQVFVDVSRGELGWAFSTASTAGPLVKANKIKLLAIAAPQRHPSYPDVPTVAEAGGPPNFELRTWIGLFAPRGTPKPMMDKLNTDIARAMNEPDVRERLTAVGFTSWPAPGAELRKAMEADSKVFGNLTKQVKISLD
jgi:tripartite-type tricarboxylate transporter receptor subunit TctC